MQPTKKIPYDQMVLAQLQKEHLSHSIKTYGQNNGIIRDCGKLGFRFIYINSFVEVDILKHELCLINMDLDKITEKKVERIPLLYFDQIRSSNNGKNLQAVKIDMIPCHFNSDIIAVHVSTWKKNEEINSFSEKRKDVLSLLCLDNQNLFKITEYINKKKKMEEGEQAFISLLEIHSSSNAKMIRDVKWHPLSETLLCILYENETFEVWDIGCSIHCPIKFINLKILKKSKSFVRTGSFTSFDFLREESTNNQIVNRFSIFFLTENGQIYSIFPFLVPGIILTQTLINLIHQGTSQELHLLSEIIEQTKMETHTGSNKIISECPQQSYSFKMLRWNNSTQKNNKIQFGVRNSEIRLIYINKQCALISYLREEQEGETASIIVSLLLGEPVIDDNDEYSQNEILPVAEHKFKRKYPWIRNYPLVGIENLRCYFMNGGDLFYLGFENILKFANTGDIKEISRNFQYEIVLSVPESEEIVCFGNSKKSETFVMIRKTQPMEKMKEKIKFQIHSLKYLNLFDGICEFGSKADQLNSQVQKSKYNKQLKPKLNTNKNPPPHKFKVISKNIQEDYEKYCNNIKVYIDRRMKEMKEKFEIMESQISKFQGLKAKKNQLSRLFRIIQENEKLIALKLKEPTNQRKNQNDEERSQFDERVTTIRKMQDLIKKKQKDIQKNDFSGFQKEADEMLEKLKSMKAKIVKIKTQTRE